MFDLSFARQALPQIIAATPMALLIAAVATLAGLLLASLGVIVRERPLPLVTPLVSLTRSVSNISPGLSGSLMPTTHGSPSAFSPRT